MAGPHHVVALALPSVVAFDLATVAQVFGRDDEPEYTFTVATPGGRPVSTSTGFAIADTGDLKQLAHADTVVVPGHRDHATPSPGVVTALRQAHARGARVTSICTGAFALAATGLLDGLVVTTHWEAAAELAGRFPALRVDPDVLYVDHGTLATSAGVAAGIDLCLHLVRRDRGDEVATRIARRMVVPPHRDGGQAQFIQTPTVAAGTRGMAGVLEWTAAHLQDDLTVTRLARQAGMSPRHFARRFTAEVGTTPLRWLHHQRVLAARRLLETTDLSMREIAGRTGLGTEATLRRRFQDVTGVSPSSYRRAFGSAGQPHRTR